MKCQIFDALTSLFSKGISAHRWPCRNCRRQFGVLSTACANRSEDLSWGFRFGAEAQDFELSSNPVHPNDLLNRNEETFDRASLAEFARF